MKGRLLAIDYGERRIGLAISDPMQIIASGLTTLLVNNNKDAIRQIAEIIKEQEIVGIIIGMPNRTDGRQSEKATKIESFAGILSESQKVPVYFIDERYTSTIAKSMLLEAESKKKRRTKEKLDELAAVVILRAYLDSQ